MGLETEEFGNALSNSVTVLPNSTVKITNNNEKAMKTIDLSIYFLFSLRCSGDQCVGAHNAYH